MSRPHVTGIAHRCAAVVLVGLSALGAAACAGKTPMDPPAAPATGGAASDVSPPSRGELLYENHCLDCHESRLHVRDDRRANTSAAVEAQVRRWSSEQQLEWNDADIADVTGYLLLRYYRFGNDQPRN